MKEDFKKHLGYYWCAAEENKRAKFLMEEKNMVVEDTYKGGNKLADFLANHVFSFAGTLRINFLNETQLLRKAKIMQYMDKQYLLNLRIEMLQNRAFNNQGKGMAKIANRKYEYKLVLRITILKASELILTKNQQCKM